MPNSPERGPGQGPVGPTLDTMSGTTARPGATPRPSGRAGRAPTSGEHHYIRDAVAVGLGTVVTVGAVGEATGFIDPLGIHHGSDPNPVLAPGVLPSQSNNVITSPEGTFNVTFPPPSGSPLETSQGTVSVSQTPAPNESPTGNGSPSPEPSASGSDIPSVPPVDTAPPTAPATAPGTEVPSGPPSASPQESNPPQFENFKDLVNHYAEFDAGGELKDKSGDFRKNYSRALLDGADIQSISIPSSAMQKVHNIIVDKIYEAVHKRKGTQISLAFSPKGDHHIPVVLNQIESYTVSRDEYSNIKTALQASKLTYIIDDVFETEWLMYVDNNQVIYSIHAPIKDRGLAEIPSGWNKQDAGFRAASDLTAAFADVAAAAQLGLGGGFTLPKMDPVYNALGLNLRNNFGRNGNRGKFKIVFK